MKNKDKKPSLVKTFKLTFKMFKFWHKEFPWTFLPQILDILAGNIGTFFNIYFSARILDELVTTRDLNRLFYWTFMLLVSELVIRFINVIISCFRSYQLWPYYYKWNKFYTDKLLTMDFASIDNPKNQELLEKVKQGEYHSGRGVGRAMGISHSVFNGLFGITSAVALSVTLFTSKVPESAGGFTILNNPLFALLIFAVMLGVVFASSYLSVKASYYDEKIASKSGFSNRLFGFYMSFVDDSKRSSDIRIYSQDRFVEGFSERDDLTFSNKGIAAKYAKGGKGILTATSSAISGLFTGLVYLFVGVKAWAGAFGAGYITQYIIAITKLSATLSAFFTTVGDMQTNAAFLERSFELLDMPNIMEKGDLPVSCDNYEIEFRDVFFKYPGTELYALENINLKFRIGEKMAVVGENGSGKTTFIKLLCRLYEPTEGEILLNGKNIKEYSYKEYMSVFSVIFQDFRLLPFTLAQNVAASEDYDSEKVIDCLNKAGFGDRLAAFPDGINTYIYKDFKNDGVNVSGGEAQKIAIARALYKDSPFIILDEPTAALDPVAEFEIYSKFNEMVGQKTAIFISHRLSSCRFCDDIAVFDKGKLIQRGSHKTLIDEDGKYSELWNAQAQYYA